MRAMEENPLFPRQAVIEEKIQETRDTCSMCFRVEGCGDFYFEPGQFNMLGLPGFGEAAISFSSLPLKKGGFVHTIKAVGNVTNAVCRLEAGDSVQIRGPFGSGWPMDRASGKHIIIVAGGIGMAPLRPVIHEMLKHAEKYRELFLLYGSRREEDILYREEMSGWLESGNLHVRLSVDEEPKQRSFPVSVGVVTTLMDRANLPTSESVVLICGPEIMIRFAVRQLMRLGHHPGNLYVSLERRMKCGIAHCGHCQVGPKYVCRDGPVFAFDEVRSLADSQ